MWTAVNRFSHLVASFDKTVFLTHDVVNVVTRHFHDIRYADRRYKYFRTRSLTLCQSLTIAVAVTLFKET